MTPTIVKLEPAERACQVWKVLIADDRGETPVDFIRLSDEVRSFVGDGGYFQAEPDVDGWRLIARTAS